MIPTAYCSNVALHVTRRLFLSNYTYIWKCWKKLIIFILSSMVILDAASPSNLLLLYARSFDDPECVWLWPIWYLIIIIPIFLAYLSGVFFKIENECGWCGTCIKRPTLHKPHKPNDIFHVNYINSTKTPVHFNYITVINRFLTLYNE